VDGLSRSVVELVAQGRARALEGELDAGELAGEEGAFALFRLGAPVVTPPRGRSFVW
jgi:hypothetical protein